MAAVITISRQYASGGSEIARRVAEQLGWHLVDNEFVDLVAQRAGWTRDDVVQHEERVEGLIERLARTLSGADPETFLAAGEPNEPITSPEEHIHRVTQMVLAEVTLKDDVVLVGRGAQSFVERPDALHVMVVAPRATRVEAACEKLGMSKSAAKRRVDAVDNQRREYVRARYGRTWEDPANYHLVVNSGLRSFDDCARLVVAAAKLGS